jgi:hypothetical protein
MLDRRKSIFRSRACCTIHVTIILLARTSLELGSSLVPFHVAEEREMGRDKDTDGANVFQKSLINAPHNSSETEFN